MAANLWDEPVATQDVGVAVVVAGWHETQRSLSPKEKVRILLALQRRELEANRIREALGRPTRRMKLWDIEP